VASGKRQEAQSSEMKEGPPEGGGPSSLSVRRTDVSNRIGMTPHNLRLKPTN